jgi:hypothetical protein
MEHRWGQRIALERSVRLTARPLALGVGRFGNLSLSGAWIHTSLVLAPGALVGLHVEQSESAEGSAPAVEACVVRCDGTGLGIEWCELAPVVVLQWLQHATGEVRDLTSRARARASPRPRVPPIRRA